MVETPKAQARLEKLFLPFPVRPVTVRFKAFRLFWPRRLVWNSLRVGKMTGRIVVIVASAGGLEPLRTIMSRLPVPCAASIFIVWHVGPTSQHTSDHSKQRQ